MTSGDGQRHDPGMEPTAPTNDCGGSASDRGASGHGSSASRPGPRRHEGGRSLRHRPEAHGHASAGRTSTASLAAPARDLPKRRRARRLHGELPGEELIVQTGLAASGRLSDASKPGLAALSTFPRWSSTACSCRAADCISSASSSGSSTASEPTASWSAGSSPPPRGRTCFGTQRRTSRSPRQGGRPRLSPSGPVRDRSRESAFPFPSDLSV